MVISYFLLNKGLYETYEYTYDIRKIFLVLYEIRKFVKYIRNANTINYTYHLEKFLAFSKFVGAHLHWLLIKNIFPFYQANSSIFLFSN